MNENENDRSQDLLSKLSDAIDHTNEILEEFIRPFVIVDVYPRWQVNTLYFRIRNVGHSPAYDISLKIDPAIPIRQRTSSELNIFKQLIPILGPMQEISFYFDSAINIFNKEPPLLNFPVEYSYFSQSKKQYLSEIMINLDVFRNLSIELPALDGITEKLERIDKSLEHISRYADYLRTKEFEQMRKENDE